MPALICGSLAFDTIMNFEGRFAEQILPEQLHILNVSFLVPGLRREYGGCAGNIAYGLRQLGGHAIPVAMLGNDGHEYLARLDAIGVDTRLVRLCEAHYTAQAMIMTDHDNNQITAFHPGAMMQAHDIRLDDGWGAAVGIVSPDGRTAMLEHAEQFAALGVPFVFDPGQGLPMFDGPALSHFLDLADWAAMNDYEAGMLAERVGASLADISRRLRGLVVTLGARGCDVWEDGVCHHVPGVHTDAVVDPTGCGDAFRAALLYGLEQGWDLRRCAALGNQVGAIKIASRGGQNYTLDAPRLIAQVA